MADPTAVPAPSSEQPDIDRLADTAATPAEHAAAVDALDRAEKLAYMHKPEWVAIMQEARSYVVRRERERVAELEAARKLAGDGGGA